MAVDPIEHAMLSGAAKALRRRAAQARETGRGYALTWDAIAHEFETDLKRPKGEPDNLAGAVPVTPPTPKAPNSGASAMEPAIA